MELQHDRQRQEVPARQVAVAPGGQHDQQRQGHAENERVPLPQRQAIPARCADEPDYRQHEAQVGGEPPELTTRVALPGYRPNGGAEAKFTDFNMLVGSGGQDRTRAEYEAHFAAAGFRLVGATPIAGEVSVIEGVPA